jgi:hypothetical protein
MGLKIAEFTLTNRYGGTENIYLTWKKIMDADFDNGGSVAFAAYENEDEAGRRNQKDLYKMPVTHQQILGMFAQSGTVALVISDVCWTLANSVKFIPDFTLNVETGSYEESLKSLDDLNATITDIGNPFE